MPAGPSEVMVVADDNTDADFVAADLLSQAEHGKDSQVIVVAESKAFADKVMTAVNEQASRLPRGEFIASSLAQSAAIIIDNKADALAVINQYAPEHLIMQVENADSWIADIKHAGSVFVGAYTPESLGDYASGTNHVLPTYGYATVSYTHLTLPTKA